MSQMTLQHVAPTTAPGEPPRSLATRFGTVAVDAARRITFPVGLLGFSGWHQFVLGELDQRASPFKLLQAADDGDLGFVVLPLAREGGLVAWRDLEDAAEALGIADDDLVVLGVVTLRPEGDGMTCTVNLKAPLIVDSGRRLGWQYVLTSDAYDLRHPIALGARHGG